MTSSSYHSDRNEENPVLEAALRYAGLGYPVIPLLPGDKKPNGRLVPNGKDDASTDPETIRRWFTESPSSNLGLLTDGLLVVDIDGQNNPWPNDPDKGADLAEAGAVAETGRKGKHIVYRKPEDKNWRNSTGALAPHVDTKTDGGYIVVWPSVGYRWIEGLELDRSPDDLPEPPEWLVAQLDSLGSTSSGARTATGGDSGEDIPDGQRNSTLFSIGCAHRRIGSSEQAILAALLVVNDERCKPPLPADEVEKIAASAAKYDPDQCATDMAEGLHLEDEAEGEVVASTSTPMESFPVDECFPPKVAEYIHALSAALMCDTAMVALPMMAVIASVIGGRRLVRINSTWNEPCALWTILSVPSGGNKSAVVERVAKPAEDADREMRNTYTSEMADYECELAIWKASDPVTRGRAPERPIQHRCKVSDTTIEKLGVILSANPRGVLVSRDELTAWFTGMTRYSSADDSSKWLSFHDGKDETIDRQKYDNPISLKRPLVSVCGGIQPGILAKHLTAQAWASGMAQRFLAASPPVRLRKYFEPPEKIPGEAEYRDAITWMIESLKGKQHPSLSEILDGEGFAAFVRIAPEAHAVWVKDHDARCVRAHGAKGGTAGTVFKLVSTSARWALCHHTMMAGLRKEQGLEPISLESINAGIRLANWFEKEAMRLLGVNAAASTAMELDGIVRLAIASGTEGISAREVRQWNRKLCPDVRTAGELLTQLVEAGQLVSRTVKLKRKKVSRYFPAP